MLLNLAMSKIVPPTSERRPALLGLQVRSYSIHFFGLLLALAAVSCSLRADDVESVYSDPGLKDPRLRFHLGETANNQPLISPVYPDMPFPISEWALMQWGQSSCMSGDKMTTDDALCRDPQLGVARYAFAPPDGHSHLWIYKDNASGAWVYEISERDGTLRPGGGSNIFLANGSPRREFTLDREITYSVDLKLTQAEATYLTPTARQSGAVLAMAFTGFGILFKDPETKQQQFVFLQIPISSSRSISFPGTYIFLPTKGERPNLLYGAALLSGEPTLPFAPDTGTLHPFRYLLNRYVAQLISKPYRWKGEMVEWPAAAHDFHNWSLKGMYIGLETQATDLRPTSTNHDRQGSVVAALQISNLEVMRHNDRVFDSALPKPTP